MENTSRFEVYQGARGIWHWRLLGEHGGVLARSPSWYAGGYVTRADCLNGLNEVKRLVGEAEVVEAQ